MCSLSTSNFIGNTVFQITSDVLKVRLSCIRFFLFAQAIQQKNYPEPHRYYVESSQWLMLRSMSHRQQGHRTGTEYRDQALASRCHHTNIQGLRRKMNVLKLDVAETNAAQFG